MLEFMNEKISSWEKIKESGKPVVIYGMGNGADKVIVVDDPELKDLKDEVQKELKKQRENQNNTNPFAEYERKKAQENKSVLGI